MTMKKRKPMKARPKKTVKKVSHEVWVQPKGPWAWRIEYDGLMVGKTRHKFDAVALGTLIARLSGEVEATELYVALRNGQIEDRSTFPRSADPSPPKG